MPQVAYHRQAMGASFGVTPNMRRRLLGVTVGNLVGKNSIIVAQVVFDNEDPVISVPNKFVANWLASWS